MIHPALAFHVPARCILRALRNPIPATELARLRAAVECSASCLDTAQRNRSAVRA